MSGRRFEGSEAVLACERVGQRALDRPALTVEQAEVAVAEDDEPGGRRLASLEHEGAALGVDMPAAEQVLGRAAVDPGAAKLEHLVGPEVELVADAGAARGRQVTDEAAGEDEPMRALRGGRRRLCDRERWRGRGA